MARARSGKLIERQGLSTAWERSVGRTAAVFAIVALFVSVAIAIGLARRGFPLWVSLPLSALIAWRRPTTAATRAARLETAYLCPSDDLRPRATTT